MASNIAFAVLIIPLILVITLATFSGFSHGSQAIFEGSAITNELLGNVTADGAVLTPAYNIVDDDTAACKVRLHAVTLTALTNPTGTCAITENAGYNSYVTVTTNYSGTNATLYMNYTPYSKTGYTQFSKVVTNTGSGMSLSSLLPFILIAMVVIGVIIGGLAM